MLRYSVANNAAIKYLMLPTRPDMGITKWYFLNSRDQPAGPFTLAQIKQFVASNRLTHNTLIAPYGSPTWVPIGKADFVFGHGQGHFKFCNDVAWITKVLGWWWTLGTGNQKWLWLTVPIAFCLAVPSPMLLLCGLTYHYLWCVAPIPMLGLTACSAVKWLRGNHGTH